MSKPEFRHIPLAFGLLSRLPFASTTLADDRDVALSAWSFPLVGGVIGVITAIIALLLSCAGVSASIVAAFLVALPIILTGAMHEDGLADMADGFWGGWTTERRLEIMKDSRIGTYGVLALVLAVLIRWAAYSALLTAGWSAWVVIAIFMLSRAPMVAAMTWMPGARKNGLSASVGTPPDWVPWLALGSAAVMSLPFIGIAALIGGVFFMALVCFGTSRIAMAKIGGQTGDVLGAMQQLSEITILIWLTALIP